MRRVVVPCIAAMFVMLLVWSGWHNRRAREMATQETASRNVLAMLKTQVGASVSLRGKMAPGFRLVNMEGREVALSDYAGRPVLVNFWGASCGPCKLEMPWLQEFRQRYAAQGFEILGIESEDAPKEQVAKIVGGMGVSYPILLPGAEKVMDAYDVQVLPMSFYVGRDGKVVEQVEGVPVVRGKEAVEEHIRSLLAL